MSEETVVAAPSAAEEIPEFDHSRGPLVDLSPEQRSEYKRTGELPKIEPKKAESAPAPKAEEIKSETEPEADAGTKQQEHTGKKKPTAEERIAQLEATIEKIRKGAGIERKAEPAPAPVEQPKPQQEQQPPQFNSYDEWETKFIDDEAPKWIEQWAKEHPDKSYESANAAMLRYMRSVERQFEAQRTSMAQLGAKLNDAKSRYGERFDEVLNPTLQTLSKGVQPNTDLWNMMEDSDVLVDVLYVMGTEEGGAEKFLAMTPGQKVRWFALNESLVRETLEAKAEQKSEAKADPPAKPKTSAPPPPTELGRSVPSADPVESAVKANDYRRASAEWTRRAIASMK